MGWEVLRGFLSSALITRFRFWSHQLTGGHPSLPTTGLLVELSENLHVLKNYDFLWYHHHDRLHKGIPGTSPSLANAMRWWTTCTTSDDKVCWGEGQLLDKLVGGPIGHELRKFECSTKQWIRWLRIRAKLKNPDKISQNPNMFSKST